MIDLRTYGADIDSTSLAGLIVSGPAHGALTQNANGTFTYTPTTDYSGADIFTYRISDGALASATATVSIVITPSNVAPVALASSVTTDEDDPYVFAWADFHVSDADGDALSIVVTSLPVDGLLQRYDGLAWVAVTVGQVISRTDIEAGNLCFGPEASESGYDGYAATGTGNLKRDYAKFTWQATDGQLLSAQATMTIDVTPLADTPLLTLMDPPGEDGATRERFRTSWETAANKNTNRTVLPQGLLEGWFARTSDGVTSDAGFIVWSTGDKMKDAQNNNRTVSAAAGDGKNWIEIGDGGVNHQSFGIDRLVRTRLQATYTLSFDYAGHLGYDANHTRIAVYLDNVKVGSYANTSPNTALNWQTVSFSFTGNGNLQDLRIVMDGNVSGDRGAMIDDIVLIEDLPLNTGYSDNPIRLSAIVSSLVDTDGSEGLALTVGTIPVGARLTDGVHTFTATAGNTTATVTAWDLDNLSVTAPASFTGTFDLLVTAKATEAATLQTALKTRTLTVTVLPSEIMSPIVVDLNGDGVQTVSLAESAGVFDLLNSGTAIQSGWISPEDAFLAVDTNGNGVIDDRSELFGGSVGEGFAKLAMFDSNLDGTIDARDVRFAELRLWQDRDGDHVTDSGELASLAERGVTAVSARYTMQPEQQDGNWLLERGTATLADGRVVATADAYFEISEEDAAKYRTAQTRRREEDRGATLVVESRLPSPPQAADPIIAAGAVMRAPDEQMPVIDWTASLRMGNGSIEATEERKKARQQGWVADFLGTGLAGRQRSLAERTGLKVVLNTEGAKQM